jgi:hypothetical protein
MILIWIGQRNKLGGKNEENLFDFVVTGAGYGLQRVGLCG